MQYEDNEMRNLYICERPYPLYRTLIKAMQEFGQHDIFLSNHADGMEKMLQPIRESGIFRNVFFFDDIEYNKFNEYGKVKDYFKFPKGFFILVKKFYLYLKLQKSAKELRLPERLDIMAYDDIYVNDAASSMSLYLFSKKQKFICVEHSKNAFQVKMSIHFLWSLTGILERIGVCYGLHGTSRYVKAIEVSDAKNLISATKRKVIREVNLDKLLNEMSDGAKDQIFGIYEKAYGLHISRGKKAFILLTQPLYADGLLTDEMAQIRLYHKIIEDYMKDADMIVIKPHPRDQIDYRNFVPNSIIVDPVISAEILNLSSKLYFEKAVTLFSSSIHSFTNAKNRIILGKDYIDKNKHEIFLDN